MKFSQSDAKSSGNSISVIAAGAPDKKDAQKMKYGRGLSTACDLKSNIIKQKQHTFEYQKIQSE